MKEYDGPEGRTGKLKERIIKILGRVLSDHLQFDKDIISAEDLFGEIILLARAKGERSIQFKFFFRELHAIGSAEDVDEVIRKIAKYIYQRSHHLDKKDFHNQRQPR